MKTASVTSKLSRFKSVTDNNGNMIYYSRREDHGNRFIKVVNQGEYCAAFPMVSEPDGNQRLVFHAKTIKSLIQFLEA